MNTPGEVMLDVNELRRRSSQAYETFPQRWLAEHGSNIHQTILNALNNAQTYACYVSQAPKSSERFIPLLEKIKTELIKKYPGTVISVHFVSNTKAEYSIRVRVDWSEHPMDIDESI
jgi:hypothetical protein